MDGRIEMRAGMFAHAEIVPIPAWAARVVMRNFRDRERIRRREWRRQLNDRRRWREGLRQRDALDRARQDRGCEFIEQHVSTLSLSPGASFVRSGLIRYSKPA